MAHKVGTKVGIIGAGPGGLAAAVLLQSRGFEVEIFEAQDQIGGRNANLRLKSSAGDFSFDTGPTFFLLPEVLEEIFHACGRSISEYLDLRRIDPLYRLDFGDGTQLSPSGDPYEMSREIGKFSERDANAFWLFRNRQKEKFEALYPALRKTYLKWSDYLSLSNLAAVPFLDLSTVYDELSRYFEDERVRLSFTFQAKYLGMSPFDCPSLFTILPHIEHSRGVWYPIGGCNQITKALAKLFAELGGKVHLSARVKECLIEDGAVKAFDVEGQGRREFDFSVLNADFAYSMKDLVPDEKRVKYTNAKLDQLKYSCSTYMIYLGIKGTIDMPVHSIYFAKNYRKNLRELAEEPALSADPSFYVHNPSSIDPTIAPSGYSCVYILVPVPNMDSGLDWKSESAGFREVILNAIQERTGIDLRPNIVTEKITTPLEWWTDFKVFKGAVFSLSHSLDQMLNFRPHNEFEEFKRFYLVGGGTHPGSGLPTIFESGRIAADLIEKRVAKEAAIKLRDVPRLAAQRAVQLRSQLTDQLTVEKSLAQASHTLVQAKNYINRLPSMKQLGPSMMQLGPRVNALVPRVSDLAPAARLAVRDLSSRMKLNRFKKKREPVTVDIS